MTLTFGNNNLHRNTIQMKRPLFRLVALWSCVLITLYCCSYCLLSLQGTYGPAAFGSNGIKWYAWYPKGFAYNGWFGYSMSVFYAPLLSLDRSVWHTKDKRGTGEYRSSDIYPW